MNTNSFLQLCVESRRRFVDTGVQSNIHTIDDTLGRLTKDFNDQQARNSLGEARTQFRERIAQLTSDPLPVSWQQELATLGWAALVDDQLFSAIEGALSSNDMTPVAAAHIVQPLRKQVDLLVTAFTTTISGFQAMKVDPQFLAPGEVALATLIPRARTNSELSTLRDDLGHLEVILRPFQELVTGSVEPLIVANLESPDFGIAVLLSPLEVAECVTQALYLMMPSFEKIKRIGEIWRRAREEGLGGAFEESATEKAREIVTGTVTDIVAELIKKHSQRDDAGPGRTIPDVEQNLTASLNLFADKINGGYGFDILTRNPEGVPDDEATRETLERLNVIRGTTPRGGFQLSPGEPMPLELKTAAVVYAPRDYSDNSFGD